MNFRPKSTIRLLINIPRLFGPKFVQTKEFLFGKYFLMTNIAISTTFSGIGDVIEQYIERAFLSSPANCWDYVRTLKLSATGLPIGFISHFWYLHLDKRYTTKTHTNVFKKILLSQLIYAPVCILVFFLTLSVLNRQSARELHANLVSKGQRLYIVDWIFWPPVSLVNFYLVPLRYRLLYENIISIGFDTFNSYVYHNYPNKFDNKKRT